MSRPSWSFFAVAVLMGALALLYRTVGDRTAWSECLTIWPPALWCVVAVPRLVVLAVRRRGHELAAALGLVAAFLAVTMEWPRFATAGATRTQGAWRVRVVSWNVAGRVSLDRLQAWQPDLCLLQEIGAVRERDLAVYWQGWHWRETLDPGTLSRWPATPLPTRKVGPWAEPQVLRLEGPGGRRLVAVNVRLMLPAFVVAAASFERPSLSALAEAHDQRLHQFEALVALIRETLERERTRSAILCGDFNTPGGVRSLEPLRSLVQDVWPRVGRGWGATMTEWMPVSRIDQCWATSDIRPLDAWVERGPSDQRALIVDLDVP